MYRKKNILQQSKFKGTVFVVKSEIERMSENKEGIQQEANDLIQHNKVPKFTTIILHFNLILLIFNSLNIIEIIGYTYNCQNTFRAV